MTWRDRRLPGSFRGVQFPFTEITGTGGRRVKVYEYALRDEPDTEDFGAKTKYFSINAFAIGPNYDITAEAIEQALNVRGPGIFVHPEKGEMLVQATDYRRGYSTSEGGMATFTIDFVRTSGGITQPATRVDTAQQVINASTNAEQAIIDDFLENYTADGVPQWVRDAAAEILEAARNVLNITLPTSPDMLAAQPQEMATALIEGTRNTGFVTLPALQRALDFGRDMAPVEPVTFTRKIQAANQTALLKLTRGAALVGAAHRAATRKFDNVAEAHAWRDQLVDAIDRMADDAANEAVYYELAGLRTRVVEDIRTRSAILPRLATLELAQTEPALVIAWRLYGDANRQDEIIARNNIAHPGFVPGGEPLEVLIDAA